MDTTDKKKRKRRYETADNILFGLFIAFLLLEKCIKISEVIFLISLLIFTVVSGVVAYLHSKLPKEMQEKPNWLRSAFSIHPYVTFILFIILTAMITASMILPKLY